VILSETHRFVFVRGRKVAGTSVEMALSTLCGPDDIAGPMLPQDEYLRQSMGGHSGNYSADPRLERAYVAMVMQSPPALRAQLKRPPSFFKSHMGVAAIEARYGSLAGFRVLCVERNPYARTLSAIRDPARFDAAAADGEFERLRSVKLYRNLAGEIVAEPMRYETLAEDFAAMVASLGAAPVALPHAKRGGMSNGFDPQAVFTRAQLDRINDELAEEFEFGGYSRL
jgi:hypothetical protein